MLLKPSAPVERNCPRRVVLLAGGALLTLAVLGAGAGLAAPAPEPEKSGKNQPKKDGAPGEEPKKDAKKSRDSAIPGLPPGMTLEELLRNSGLSDEQFRALTNKLPDDNTLKELMEEHQRVLQQLQGLLGNPGPGLQLLPNAGVGRLLQGRNARRPEARLGVGVSKPDATLVDQLDLPDGQGLALDDVRAGSAADKVGLKGHDILLELDGKPVSSNVTEFLKDLAAIPANKAVDVVILRRGKRETLKGLKLPELAEAGTGVQVPGMPLGLPQLPRLPGDLGGFGGGRGFGQGGPGFSFGFNLNTPAPGGPGVMTTTFRTDDRFTTRQQEGSLIITLTGKITDGKAKVTEVQIQDGKELHTYESVNKVPEAYRDKVKQLVKMVGMENVRIRAKEFDGIKPEFRK